MLFLLFLEPHWLHKTSNHPVISKLTWHFYLQHPPSHKCFDPWDVECLLSLLESWAPASSLTTFKLAWKIATLLVLVTAKHCSDLTVLCIDNQHLFLQHNVAISIPMSGGIFPMRFVLSLIPMLILALFFIWSLIWDILNHLGQSQMDHMWLLCFWVTIGSISLSVLKQFLLWVGKVLCVAKAHMSPGSLGSCYICSLRQLVFPGVHPAGRWLGQSFYTS